MLYIVYFYKYKNASNMYNVQGITCDWSTASGVMKIENL